MKRLALTVLLAVATGCCPTADSLDMTGQSMPVLTDVVIATAQAQCPREMVGTVEWRTDWDHESGAVGECYWHAGGCPMDVWVALPSTDHEWILPLNADPLACLHDGWLHDTALCTALAHEFGHWCLQTRDEVKAEAFGQEVLAAALLRL